MSEELVRLTNPADHVALLTVDRPPVNAVGRQVRERLVALLDELQESDDVRAIVLTGSGRLFSAGADIKEKQRLRDAGPGDRQRADRLTRDSFFGLLDSEKPVVAAVNGGALGAGMVMAACCDLIVAAESSFFAMPEIDVGQGGGASLLKRILPDQLMRRMMLTGERVPAAELYRLGAISRIVADDELVPAAVELAVTIAAKSPAAVRAIRSSYSSVLELSPREGFKVEQAYTARLSASPDADEARTAFFEKRPPRF